ncbi:MAG: 5'/3'-nucleotidase SurE [Chloroflexota bacterium]
MAYIVLTNDDGVDAPGILALARALRPLADRLQVIAPAENQSMSGHKITLFQDIRIETDRTIDNNIPAVAVHGSPADCIALASHGLVEWPPRLVVSGINRGANMGQDVVYSGTVSAAMESSIQGVPAVAVSLDNATANHPDDYAAAAQVAAQVVKAALQHGIPPFTILNINVPDVDAVRGIRLTRQGVRIYRDELEYSASGQYVKVVGDAPTGVVDEAGTDLWAVHNGYASLTPLHLDLTAHMFMAELAAWDTGSDL